MEIVAAIRMPEEKLIEKTAINCYPKKFSPQKHSLL